jgi:hypothetical protein
MATINVRAPMENKRFDADGRMSRAWQEYFATLGNKLNTALSGLEAITPVASGSDAVAVDTPVAVAGSDSVNLATLNTTLATLSTQINAIVTIINALNDKLVSTNLFTE